MKILPSTRRGYSAKYLERKVRDSRDKTLDEVAAFLKMIGEANYPKAVFVGGAGAHARHLLEEVLPDLILGLKGPQ